MAYVTVPKDFTKVKSKVALNLTKRQLVCFGAAAVVGVPLFFLIKDSVPQTAATFIMVLVMLPFFIKELDRLGRNKEEIKEELNKLRSKKVHIRITNIPTTMHDFGEDDWILDMVNNILIEVLVAVAEQERITNRQRQAEGIAAARARSVHLGRPVLKLPEHFEYYYQCWETKTMLRAEILDALQIDAVKWSSYCRSYKNHQKPPHKTDNN